MSHDHTHKECPYLEIVHYTDDTIEKGFECPFWNGCTASRDVVPKVKMKTICKIWTSSTLLPNRATRGLYDTGADECTLNDPYIINLALLPVAERVNSIRCWKEFFMGAMLLYKHNMERASILKWSTRHRSRLLQSTLLNFEIPF